MKYTLLLAWTLLILSCNNKTIIQLAEIDHSKITQIREVSAVYLFYDETQIDSVRLNRKNSISTTNWLVNVDKRLTLKQVIPHIKFLQDKKQHAGHHNPNAKNYFTCHDTSRNNLGFLEFTNTKFEDEVSDQVFLNEAERSHVIHIRVGSLSQIQITCFFDTLAFKWSTIENLKNDMTSLWPQDNKYTKIILSFDNKMSFQDYVTIKSVLSNIEMENVVISNTEYILN
ncbi:hypothetical protein [Aestuariivivens sediminis]|uniref:hypothetical protein n=1 Tax=Aestuariivivens sediminis TaxID=2913557 RepID=UPI001F59F8EF|nr:hypothetical protein [Aestuariivivens sediminis]